MNFASSNASEFDSADGQLAPGMISAKKDQIMNQVRQELAVANAQELVTKMQEKCFEKCITKPGTKLDGSDQSCLVKCMDRYMDAWNMVSKTYHSRVQRETQGMH